MRVEIVVIYDTNIKVSRCLTRRPAQLSGTEDMDMEVVDGLSSVGSVVDHHSIACLVETKLGSGSACNDQKMAQQLLM